MPTLREQYMHSVKLIYDTTEAIVSKDTGHDKPSSRTTEMRTRREAVRHLCDNMKVEDFECLHRLAVLVTLGKMEPHIFGQVACAIASHVRGDYRLKGIPMPDMGLKDIVNASDTFR